MTTKLVDLLSVYLAYTIPMTIDHNSFPPNFICPPCPLGKNAYDCPQSLLGHNNTFTNQVRLGLAN